MDYLPITYQNRESGSPHNPMPMRDLLKSLLHEELSNHHVVKQEPLKWTQSFQLHHHFHPGEVKVFIKDGKLRLHAKHARGEDEENCDIRESKRSVTLPADIDRSRIHCYSHGHQLVVEAPFLAKGQNEGEEIEIEETDDETADDTSSCFRQDMDLSTFTPDHIRVQRCGPDVIVRADHCLDEDGIKVSRSFHREFKIPPNVSSDKLRCRRNNTGMLMFWAPFQAERK